MGSNWKTHSLGELFEFGSGLSKPRSEFGSGYGFLSFKDVFHNFFVPDELTELVNSTEHERETRSVKRGDVFLTRTSETQEELGMSCVALKNYDGATFNGFTKRLRPKPGVKIEPEYAGYFFRGPRFRNEISAFSSLSTRASLNNDILGRLTIVLPPLQTQKAIGVTLKRFDDKIELNRRMNRTLEAIAQALFKSWFVDFDPVKAKAAAKAAGKSPSEIERAAMAAISGKPEFELDDLPESQRQSLAQTAALFPDALTGSELGEIPDGWAVVDFGSLAALDTTSTKPFKFPSKTWEHYSIPAFDESRLPAFEPGSNIKSNKYVVKPRAILSSKLNPRFPRTWWPLMLDPDAAVCSTEFMQFVPEEENGQAFIYSLISSSPFQAGISERVSGSTGSHQRAQPKQVAKMDIVSAGPTLRSKYAEFSQPLFELVLRNRLISRTLAELRDTLLPKLLSGELSVDAIEDRAAKARTR